MRRILQAGASVLALPIGGTMKRFLPYEQRIHEEANYFAMHLLVPDSLLAKEDLSGLDWTDDRALMALAHKFGVPIGVMVIRLQEFRGRNSR